MILRWILPPASGAPVASLECIARLKVKFMISNLEELFQSVSMLSV